MIIRELTEKKIEALNIIDTAFNKIIDTLGGHEAFDLDQLLTAHHIKCDLETEILSQIR